MSRNVLLDCGTHFGQGLQDFIARFHVDDTWIVHSFEANPVTYKINMTEKNPLPYVTYHNAAIHDSDGTVTINVETPPNEGETGMGSSIISLDKWYPWDGQLQQNFKTDYDVKSIRFAKFIKDNFKPDDNIIIKMDIEGAEFAVVEDMLNMDVMQYVKFIAIEWHSHFFTNKSEMKQKENELIARITQTGVKHECWH